jgi:hypothetical protein
MIFRPIALAGALLMAATVPASGQQAEDEIVRLPGQGFTKSEARKRSRYARQAGRWRGAVPEL